MATQRRQLTADEFWRLWELGVLGEKVELLNGWIVYGRYPFAFSEEAVAAARAAGIELDNGEPSSEAIAAARAVGIEIDQPAPARRHELAALGTPPAPTDDAEALALAALIERADVDAIAAATDDLARAGAERDDGRLLAAADRLREAALHRRHADDVS